MSRETMAEPDIQEHGKIYRKIFRLSGISMFCGILSIISLIAVTLFRGDPPEDIFIAETALIAVITGSMAMLKIRKYPKISDKSMAITGLVCGGIIILYIAVFFMVVLVKYIFA
jgi:hypothetical protein